LNRPTTNGVIAGSPQAPYPDLAANVRPGGMLNELARANGKRIVFYCAFGERSAIGPGRAGCGPCLGLSHPGRHRRLEESGRAAPALARLRTDACLAAVGLRKRPQPV